MESLELETTVIDGGENLGSSFDQTSAGNKLMLQTIDSEELFDSVGPHWKDLAKRTNATIFMSYEWAKTWWQNFGRNSRRSLLILTIWDGTKLVGLAPFYRGYSSIGGMEIETRLQIIGSGGSPNEQIGYMDDYGISDFLDILADKDYADQIADMLCKIITSNALDVDTINFHQARNDSYLLNYLYPRLQETNLEMSLEHTDTCPYISLDGQTSLKGYIKSVKSNARRRFRQSLRAMKPEASLELEELTTWEEMEKATETMIELHQDRWNRIGFPGVFYDTRFTKFFRETVRYAFDNGWLWFKQMKDDKGVCAARMLLHYNGRYFDYISGFDDLRKSSKYRPGIGLLVEAVRDAIDDGADTVELLRGEEGYKYDFTKKNFKNWKLSIKLENNKNSWQNSINRFTEMVALFYKRATREARLMRVQRSQNGFLKMLPGYVSFRWNSFKMRANN